MEYDLIAFHNQIPLLSNMLFSIEYGLCTGLQFISFCTLEDQKVKYILITISLHGFWFFLK